MSGMKRIFRVVVTVCAWAFLALVVLYFRTTLLIPLWYMFLAVAGGSIVLVYRRKRSLLRPVSLTLGVVLLISYFVFEFVPLGSVPENKTVNGVAFKDIAGSYYYGDGLGVNCSLHVTPAGRFSFAWSGCLGVYDRNKGTVTVTGDTLTLHPKKANPRDGFRGTPTAFIPVKWGDRIYLVPADQMVEFCSEINLGNEPRERPHGRFYLRRQDWKKPCTGWPAVGERWTPYLLPQPVRGRITSLQDKQTGTVDLGARQGLRKGMTLTARSGDTYLFSMAEVVSVGETESVVRCLWQDSVIHSNQVVASTFHDDGGSSNSASHGTGNDCP
jgi:hypothetical protein